MAIDETLAGADGVSEKQILAVSLARGVGSGAALRSTEQGGASARGLPPSSRRGAPAGVSASVRA